MMGWPIGVRPNSGLRFRASHDRASLVIFAVLALLLSILLLSLALWLLG